MQKRNHPHIFEVNAWVYLKRLSRKYGKRITVSSIPAEEWKALAGLGFDYVWLMGVWKRSAGARDISLTDPDLKKEYGATLPGWRDEDISGSPYAIYDYELDPQLGAEGDLAILKKQLHQQGLGLILDYVPNHLAMDHPSTLTNPSCFIQGTKENFEKTGLFFETKNGFYLAHGKDPYFPPWKDTVQINFFSRETCGAAKDVLLKIAQVADGVRCDMAMLALNDVFEKTWGSYWDGLRRPKKEYWEEVIPHVKAAFPDFVFIAEAYWDLEWELQQLGFDYTYDKKLYDRLMRSSVKDIRDHLKAEPSYQTRSLRFIENHDEPRASSSFSPDKSFAAAVITTTIPGSRLIHDGQMEGKKIRLPVHLGTEPEEMADPHFVAFYKRLLHYADAQTLHAGKWQLLDSTQAGEGNDSHHNLLSWAWCHQNEARVIVVNYAPELSQGRLLLPGDWLKNSSLFLRDQLSGETYERSTSEIAKKGLYVELGSWKAHLFELNIT